MWLFDLMTKKKTVQPEQGRIYAPASGQVIPLEEIPDKAFSSGILGKGIGIVPDGNVIAAPINGTLTAFAQTGHAIGITSEDGAELIIHVGIDTVEMNGDGFRPLAQKGDKVCCGQKLLKFSRQKIEDAGYSPIIGFTVSNSDEMEAVTFDSTGFAAIGDAIGQYAVAAKQG